VIFLWGVASLFSLFWCLDAKGGEVFLFRICLGLGVSRGSYLLFVPVNFICVELWSNYYLIVIG
jgi:hypothetical protein